MRVPVLFWFLIPTVLVIGGGIWFFTKNSATTSPKSEVLPAAVSAPVEGTVEHEIMGRGHIASGTAGSGYSSNPPSSGPHWPNAAQNGVYDQSLPDEQLIHNLEHGHVWISYKPDVPVEVVDKLKGIVKDDDWKVVLEPRDKNETMIALVSWGRVLKMDQLDEQKVKDFIRTYRNRGPENTPS